LTIYQGITGKVKKIDKETKGRKRGVTKGRGAEAQGQLHMELIIGTLSVTL
jgi:hypothetical protein